MCASGVREMILRARMLRRRRMLLFVARLQQLFVWILAVVARFVISCALRCNGSAFSIGKGLDLRTQCIRLMRYATRILRCNLVVVPFVYCTVILLILTRLVSSTARSILLSPRAPSRILSLRTPRWRPRPIAFCRCNFIISHHGYV